MTARSNARAGRFSLGEVDLNSSWSALSSDISRAEPRGPGKDRGPLPPVPGSLPFGHGQSEAESQLYAYLDRVREARPAPVFAPLAELSARLGELPALSQHRTLFGDEEAVKGPFSDKVQAGPEAESAFAQVPLDWFESRFDDIKSLLLRRDESGIETASLNEQLARISQHLEHLAASFPGTPALARIEKELAGLTLRFDAARSEAKLQASRISRTAREILETAARVETMQGKTAQVLTVTSDRVAAALDTTAPLSRLETVEASIRGLSSTARESSDRTVAAVDRVHDMLRDCLQPVARDGNPEGQASVRHKKRMGVHMPISAGAAAAFTRSNTEFGAKPAAPPRIDILTERANARVPGTADAIAARLATNDATATDYGNPPAFLQERRGNAMPSSERSAQTAQRTWQGSYGEDRAFPVAGLAAVAAVLLIASAALYYLHVSRPPQKASALKPQAEILRQTVQPAASPIPATQPMAHSHVAVDAGSSKLSTLLNGFEDWRPISNDGPASKDGVQKLTEAAASGDSDAQYKIGMQILGEAALSESAVSASRWLSRAAAQGHVEAQFMLASLLEKGMGVDKNESGALDLYRIAARAGHARAMHNLGVLLVGRGAPHDFVEAASWFATAAAVGVTGSQYNLAILHEKGLGAPKDLAKAYFWFLVAARSGDAGAPANAARLRPMLPPGIVGDLARDAANWTPAAGLSEGWTTRGEVRS